MYARCSLRSIASVDIGSRVRAGEVVARINAGDLAAKRAQVEAGSAEANAAFENARALHRRLERAPEHHAPRAAGEVLAAGEGVQTIHGRRHAARGGDLFLMASRFEPCGLSQMYAMRYGSLPIVRSTGGLVDTVAQYEEGGGAGTGFRFDDLTPDALANALGWALSTWHDRRHHVLAMRERAMGQDFSWDRSAAAYEALYREAVRRRRG